MKDWWDDYGDPSSRASIVKRHLDRVGLSLNTTDKLPGPAESPATVDRAAETQKRLARQDERDGLTGGLQGSFERVSRRRYTVGDPDGRDD